MSDPRARILVVDDEESIRVLVSDYLAESGYAPTVAADGQEALDSLAKARVDLVIADIRMPVMDGLDLLEAVGARHDEVGVLMLTACDDVPMAVQAMKAGALDYIVKPFELDELGVRLSNALDRHRVGLVRKRELQTLELLANRQARELRQMLGQLQDVWDGVLDALVSALDAREHEAHAHSRRVSEYAAHLAGVMGLAADAADVIRRGAMLHDIGKIGVPDSVLLKPDKLTPDEWVDMRKHPQIGYWILDGIEGLRPAGEIVLTHHEAFDGSGYPAGIQGDAIPIGSRVFSVVDCLDAMTSDRPYRSAVSFDTSRAEIVHAAGTQFDPQVVEVFAAIPLEVWSGIRDRVDQVELRSVPGFERLLGI